MAILRSFGTYLPLIYKTKMEEKIWLTWDDNTLRWGDIDGFVWDQVYIVKKVEGMFGGVLPGDPMAELDKKLPEEEVKKFIKVVCEVNGKIYSESRWKKVQQKITVDDIKRTFDRFVDVKIGDI